MRAAVLEKLRAAAAARIGSAPTPEPRPQPAPVPEPAPAATPAPASEPPLEVAVEFYIPELGGSFWLIPAADDAQRLGLRRGEWLTPGDLMLLEPLSHAERTEVLRWMRATGGVLAAAPRPASRRPAAPKREPERKASAGVALSDELRLQALALGWTDEHLATLAGLLHPGDRIGEVSASSIEIVRKSGAVQRFYSPDAPQVWRRKVEGASD